MLIYIIVGIIASLLGTLLGYYREKKKGNLKEVATWNLAIGLIFSSVVLGFILGVLTYGGYMILTNGL